MSPHASVQATDQSQRYLVGTVRSFLCCDERIQVTFPSSILSDYVHMKGRYVFIVSVLCVRDCLVMES